MHRRREGFSFSSLHEAGNIDAILPVIVALGLFSVFSIVSVWFVLKKSDSRATAPVHRSSSSPLATNQFERSSPFQNGSSTKPPIPSPAASPQHGQQRSSSPFTGNTNQSFDQKQALDLVSRWLNYKSTLYAEPFDTSKLDQFATKTGKLYQDITKKGGAIDWLRQRSYYYKFKTAKVKKVISFKSLTDTAQLKVEVIEDLDLVTPSGVDPTQSGLKQNVWIYRFKQDSSEQWRIEDSSKS